MFFFVCRRVEINVIHLNNITKSDNVISSKLLERISLCFVFVLIVKSYITFYLN